MDPINVAASSSAIILSEKRTKRAGQSANGKKKRNPRMLFLVISLRHLSRLSTGSNIRLWMIERCCPTNWGFRKKRFLDVNNFWKCVRRNSKDSFSNLEIPQLSFIFVFYAAKLLVYLWGNRTKCIMDITSKIVLEAL